MSHLFFLLMFSDQNDFYQCSYKMAQVQHSGAWYKIAKGILGTPNGYQQCRPIGRWSHVTSLEGMLPACKSILLSALSSSLLSHSIICTREGINSPSQPSYQINRPGRSCVGSQAAWDVSCP